MEGARRIIARRECGHVTISTATMNLTRTALIGVGGGVLVVWLAAAATNVAQPASRAPARKPTTTETSGAELAAEIARLHERLRPTASPLQTRDLFRFAPRGAQRPLRPARGEAPVPNPAPVSVPPPPLTLIGIAADDNGGETVRTAVISSGGALLFAKEGESVTTRYRVSRISDEVVELRDEDDGRVVRLALK